MIKQTLVQNNKHKLIT